MSYRVNHSVHLAEEIVQEAYVRALKYFNRFDPQRGEFNQWFSIILNNACNQCRNEERNRGVVYELDAVEEYFTVPEQLITPPNDDEERFRIGLEGAIAKESERDKAILVLFFLDGFKSREIAEWIGIKDGTVRQVINRFREKLVLSPAGLA